MTKKNGFKKSNWSEEEDNELKRLVAELKANKQEKFKWKFVASGMPGKNVKQCRDRFLDHLQPGVKIGDWKAEEDE